MSDECSAYVCQVDEAPFVTSDGREYIANHTWDINLTYNDLNLMSVNRTFNLRTTFDTTASADFYKIASGITTPCNATSSGTLTGSIKEAISGATRAIVYADIQHDLFLIETSYERHTSSYTTQNPFHYIVPYGAADSIAYFMQMRKEQTVSYQLYLNGVIIFDEAGETKITTHTPQPIVWPVPSSTASFFINVHEYAWLNDTFFYWYNDPTDIGVAPCHTGFISGEGYGVLTGYSKAEADGGKDFFYPPWVRETVFVENSLIHKIWAQEAADRFINRLGGQVSATCAEPFSRDYTVSLPISSEIVGNAVVTDKQQFYSFWLPKLKKAMTKMGTQEMTEAFLSKVEGGNVCFPISIT